MSIKLRGYKRYLLFFLVLMGMFIWAVGSIPTAGPKQAEAEAIKVFVSILPQKCFVRKIGQDKIEVQALVGPGQNPTLYEPLPRQMADLSHASLYFSIGVPFETAWLDRIQALNPHLKIVNTQQGIELRAIEGRRSDVGGEVKDPHIWLDPLLVKQQARMIYRELAAFDPKNKDFYEENLMLLLSELEALYRELEDIFTDLKTRQIMVFHPAWGYLLDRFGLKQIPIELEGKEPGPRDLANIIETAKREGIKVIFAEEQFDTVTADSVARAIGGKVVKLDPLAEDYLANLRHVAKAILKEH